MMRLIEVQREIQRIEHPMVNDIARCNRFAVSSQPKTRLAMTWIELVVVLICMAVLVALLLPRTGSQPPGPRAQCRNNLKQINLALHNYHEVYGAFPPACTIDSTGKRSHSWRTLILPMMDEMKLYESIDLSKPWDDPTNLQASKNAPAAYRCPTFAGQPDQTTYLAVVTDASCLRPGKSCSLSDITDDPMQTIVIIEVPSDKSVNWMSPHDAEESVLIDIQSKSKLVHKGVFNSALASGTVSSVPVDVSAKSRRAWITVSGADKADSEL